MPLWGLGEKINPNKGKDINLPLQGLPERFPTAAPIGKHPAGLPESLIEKAIKEQARSRGTLLENDSPYLEQYLHPNYDVLEPQGLRPTINPHGDDNLPYKRPPIEVLKPNELNTDFDKSNPNRQYYSYDLGGLGRYKADDSNPNYNSIYDKWDFDTTAPLIRGSYDDHGINEKRGSLLNFQEWAAKNIMGKVGQPFHVYERTPKTEPFGFVPEDKVIQPSYRGRDINLPKK